MDFMSRKVNSMRSLRSNKLYLRFKTIERHGILFTLGKANDYLTLEIYEGRVRVETNVGGGKLFTFVPHQLISYPFISFLVSFCLLIHSVREYKKLINSKVIFHPKRRSTFFNLNFLTP